MERLKKLEINWDVGQRDGQFYCLIFPSAKSADGVAGYDAVLENAITKALLAYDTYPKIPMKR